MTMPVILLLASVSMLNAAPASEQTGTATFADAVQLATAGSLDEAETAFRTVAAAKPENRIAATVNLAWIALQRAAGDDLEPDALLEHLRSAEAAFVAAARAAESPDPRVLASLADVRRRIAAAEQQDAQQSASQAEQQAQSAAERAQDLQDLANRQQDAADSNGSQSDRQEEQDELSRQTQQQQQQQPDPSLQEAQDAQQRATEALERGDDEAARQAQQEAAQALQQAAAEAEAQAEQTSLHAGESEMTEQAEAGQAPASDPTEGEPADPDAELAERILQREQQQREQGRSRPTGPGTQPVETDW